MRQPENVIFWGAGATAALGMRTTERQTTFIKHITGVHSTADKKLTDRVTDALGDKDSDPWHSALVALITILGDRAENYGSIDCIDDDEVVAMQRNWRHDADRKDIISRIIELRLFYDWPALKSLVSICPGSSRDTFKLNDLFNLLDTHSPLGFGVRAPAGQGLLDKGKSEEQFFDARRLIGAKNALRMILLASFYIDYQTCIHSSHDDLDLYYDFAKCLGERMQRKGMELAGHHPLELDQAVFYQGDVCFVSLNYDPIALWVQFVANSHLNKSAVVPQIGSSAVPLQLFHDYGQLIPGRRIGRHKAGRPWFWMNEAATQRINAQTASDMRVRLTKFLFPHGCLCWRECPDCRKLSAYYGDQWDLRSPSLIPPPPLKAFDEAPIPDWINEEERAERETGAIDARKCLHCGTFTYAHHTQTVMQSSFKSPPPSFIEEIQRDLRATTMQAIHIIFMGYSLPPDDVAYRAFFSASRQRQRDQPVRCTIVGMSKEHPNWYEPTELKDLIHIFPDHFPREHTVNSAIDLFGDDNVRFYGGGIPNVFLDSRGKVTHEKLEHLLTWNSKS